ncbi:MAG: ABC transporter substrate-binding protein [Anaerolineales bacterium]|jgi:NitT/TauT family transport system substrate-binding protein
MKLRGSFATILATLILLSACAPITPAPATQTLPAATELPTSSPVALTTVNVCYSTAGGTQTTTWYAYENGLFQKYGLNVKLTSISSGTTAVTALLAGDVDICQLGSSAVINAVVAKQNVVLIASLYNVYPGLLMVTPDIKTVADLKGKALGINQAGSSADTGTRLLLEKIGLVPDKDVAILAVGDDNTRLAAMQAGQIAGTLLTPPYTLLARQKGYVELYDMSTIGIPYEYLGIATSRAYIGSHRSVVDNFMKAILEAIFLMKKDPAGTKAVMAKYLLLDPVKDAAALDDAYQGLIVNNLLALPYPSLPGTQTLLDVLKVTNPAAGQTTPDQVVDTTILKSLEDSGFIAGLGK